MCPGCCLLGVSVHYCFPHGGIRDYPQCQQLGGRDTPQAGLLRNVTSYADVFLAKEVKYLKKGFWGVVGVYRCDTDALRSLLLGVQALLRDQRHWWVLVPGPGTSQLVGCLPPQLTT